MKQVHNTGLFKHVSTFLSTRNSHCKHSTFSSDGKSLPNIAASVFCQGAELLSGKSGSHSYCCQEIETCVKCLNANGDKPITVVSGTVVNGITEQGVDMLVPSSQTKSQCTCSSNSRNYVGFHPAGNDVLTALLLALPPQTWSGIKDEKLMQDLHDLVSAEDLPTLLQEEVINLDL